VYNLGFYGQGRNSSEFRLFFHLEKDFLMRLFTMIKFNDYNGVLLTMLCLLFLCLSDDEEFFEGISGVQPPSGCECYQDSEKEVQGM
jgi:hypothetical protein